MSPGNLQFFTDIANDPRKKRVSGKAFCAMLLAGIHIRSSGVACSIDQKLRALTAQKLPQSRTVRIIDISS